MGQIPLSLALCVAHELATAKYGCTEVRVYPAKCGEQLGKDPSKIGSSKSLVLKSSSVQGTHWDSSLLVSLTIWDTPVLCTPPLPLPSLIMQASWLYQFGLTKLQRQGWTCCLSAPNLCRRATHISIFLPHSRGKRFPARPNLNTHPTLPTPKNIGSELSRGAAEGGQPI